MTVPLMVSPFYNEFLTRHELACFILDQKNRLSMGPQCLEFERRFALFQGRYYAVLFNSGSSANLALIQALKIMGKLIKEDCVGFSALTWATNVMPIIQLGFHPIPVDVEPDTLNISTRTLRKALDRNYLRALFVTNALGFAGNLDKIADMCRDDDSVLIEDNCEALGSELVFGQTNPAGPAHLKTGNFGLASTFSFYVAHHVSTIEGGMVCTDDPVLDETLRMVRAHGWDRDLKHERKLKMRDSFEIDNELNARYTFYDLAFNLRPTEITGFLGLQQLHYLPEIISKRQANFLRVDAAIRKNEDLIPINHDNLSVKSIFTLPIIARTPVLKSKYVERFSTRGVEFRPVISGNIQNQPFYKKYIRRKVRLPGAEMIDGCGASCGNCPEYNEEQIQTIIDAVS